MANIQDADLVLNDPIGLENRQASGNATPLDLSGADFSGKDLRGRYLMHANLEGAIFTGANLQGARMEHAVLIGADFRGANLCGVQFQHANLQSADFSEWNGQIAHLDGSQFTETILRHAILRYATLERCGSSLSQFQNADLTGATLDRCVFNGTSMRDAILVGASVKGGALIDCDLGDADINGADFFECNLSRAKFERTKNARLAKNLETVSEKPYNFQQCRREFIERWVDWEFIRAAGRLPLFGASYTALVVIFFYLGLIQFYNDKVGMAHRWANRAAMASEEKLPNLVSDPVVQLAETVKEKLHYHQPPDQAWLILGSTLLLAVASTIYVFKCPEEIKEFSRAQWCYQLKHELIHYWAWSWKHRLLRVVCGSFYLVGGALALWVIACKVWWVIWYLAGSAIN